MLRLYSALVFMTVALFLTPWERLTRRRRGRGSELLPQWLGEPRADPPPADLLIHAVSAGEMAAAGGIARQLLALRPDTRLLLTTGTDAGERMAERLAEDLPGQVGIRRLPWDRAAATQDWLYRLSPRALVVVETELWPNLFFACRRLGIPLAVASARLYTSDVARYRWIKGFMARVLDCPRWIGVQDETERQRFIAIGADPSRLRILGNAKAARRPPAPAAQPLSDSLGRPVRLLVAGSTHAPEEGWLLDALARLRVRFSDLRLVLAPRHCNRAGRLERAAAARGWRSHRSSRANWRKRDWDVLIVDRIGQLNDFYALAELVVIGGSLAGRGGQNFLEPATLGKPVIAGPDLRNFQSLADRFTARHALCQVADATALPDALAQLLSHRNTARILGRRALAAAREEASRATGYGAAIVELMEAGG